MDNVNYLPKMALEIAKSDLLASEPFVLVDVGCSLGIDEVWRVFDRHLRAFGFDPDARECERLKACEPNSHVQYYPMAVGLPADCEFLRKKAAHENANYPYSNSVIGRSSAFDQHYARASNSPGQGGPVNNTGGDPRKIGLTQFFEEQEIKSVDFVKVDTDGYDLEVLLSIESSITSHQVLGFMVECMFQGSDHETSNSFHNIDRFMKRHGYMIYSITVNKYSRSSLPAPFVYSFPAQTVSGQPVWGDVVFLRDLARTERLSSMESCSFTKVLKLACLYEIFNLPDCSAELILQESDRIAPHINPTILLDSLTPPLKGKSLRYQEYMDCVHTAPGNLFPNG